MVGETFGNYRILEKRGEGGMGMFFKATDLQLDRIVGLKTLRPELLADAELRQRLHTEAKSLARLIHHNIANVLHYLVVEDLHFIVMEYVEGSDLGELIKSSGLLPIEQLGPIVSQICAAVSYANSRGVIHRDLKPSNIMLTADGSVKVTDFGIAKILGDKAQTRTGMAAGSLQYMAPEQIRAEPVDARTDVYQLGATLYELTTGRRVFVCDSEYELMTLHLETAPDLPSSVNSRVPVAWDAVILKALQKSPDDRYQSAAELNASLQAAIRGSDNDKTVYGQKPLAAPAGALPSSGTSVEEPTAVGKSRDRSPDRPDRDPNDQPPPPSRRWLWIAAAVVVVVAIVGVIFWPRAPQITEPDTTTETTTQVADACTVVVVAQIPNETPQDDLLQSILTVIHPVSGAQTRAVFPYEGQVREELTVAPTSAVTLRLEGKARDGSRLFFGEESQAAPEGARIEMHVLLEAVDRPADPEPKPIPVDNTPAQNLAISILPFTERGNIDAVWIDGRQISDYSKWEFATQPGVRTIRLQIGMDRLTDTVTVDRNGVTEKSFFVTSGRGRLTVAAKIGGEEGGSAAIWLDGVETGFGTPFELRDVLAGPHQVDMVYEGFRVRGGVKIVEVKANDRSRVQLEMIRK